MGDECRLVFQIRICAAFEDATFDIDGEMCPLRIQNDLNILTFQAFANTERLAEQMDVAVNCNCSRQNGLRQEGQNRRTHQLHQFLKSALAIPFCGVQDRR